MLPVRPVLHGATVKHLRPLCKRFEHPDVCEFRLQDLRRVSKLNTQRSFACAKKTNMVDMR